MNDHYDVMTLKIEQSGNMRTEYLYEFVMVKNPLSLLFIIGVYKPISNIFHLIKSKTSSGLFEYLYSLSVR